MADYKKSVKFLRHYRMYVPGDQAVFSVEEARVIVAGGFGVLTEPDVPPKVIPKVVVEEEPKEEEEEKEEEPEDEESAMQDAPKKPVRTRNRMMDTSGKRGSTR